jgi:hypothetical protein
MRPQSVRLLSGLSAYTLVTLLALVFLLHTVVPASGRLTDGFMAYFVAAQTVREGEPGTRLYDDQWFAAHVVSESGGTVTDIYLANPPALAVAWVPFAFLSAHAARRIWIAFSVLCLLVSAWQVAGELSWSRQPWAIAGLSALFTLPSPTREQFGLGQMYACLLLLHVVGWRAYLKHRDARAGIALGVAMVLKVSGWPVCLLMFAQRRWIAVRWVIATAFAISLLSVPWVGIAAWRTFLVGEIPRTLRWGAATLTAYQDTTGFWQHLFRYVPKLNPAPVFDAPLLATALTLASTLAACLILIAGMRSTSLKFVAAVALSELLSPVAEQYHYIILLLPLAVLWHTAYESRDRMLGVCTLAATLLIAVPINYKAAHPMWALLHNYPRLLGGWLAFIALYLADRAVRSPLAARYPTHYAAPVSIRH